MVAKVLLLHQVPGGSSSSSGSTTTKPNNSGGSSNNSNAQNLSSNANLKSMQLDVEGISPSFNKNTTSYWIVVNESVNIINVNAIPEDSNAKVNVSGNTNLKNGSNKIVVGVTAQNGNKKDYIINVTKTDNPEKSNANLETLAIENVILEPEFSTDIIEYMAKVGSDVEELNVLAIPQIEGANVNIDKPERLEFGDNIVRITVVAADGTTQKIYTITVHRMTQEEELAEQNENQEPVEENNRGTIIIIVVISVVVLGGIGYYLYRNDKHKKVK